MTSGGPRRQRLDEAVVGRGLLESRSRAKAFIMAGDVLVNGAPARRAGTQVDAADDISLAVPPRFVSRGGTKLDAALVAFGISCEGATVADFGASTGGFTDVVLQRGASRVYAVDVGYGELHQTIRDDDRVVVMDRTNARYLDCLPEQIDLVVIDVSFISLRLILPVAARLLRPVGNCVPLIKPQFEAGRRDVGKGGVVRDSTVHTRVLTEVLGTASTWFDPVDLIVSPITGPAGNREFLAHLRRTGAPAPAIAERPVPDAADGSARDRATGPRGRRNRG
ncbi:MAG: TlyA family RNA methyltransferase [Thermomicrobiales bacterium]